MPIEALQLPVDIALLGMVLALILFILVFSAMVLYLAFRIRETFRDEKRRGVVIAKVGFLVGVLFLAAGGFYFLAQAISPESPADGGARASLTLTASYPPQVQRNSAFNVSFTITNPTEYVAHDAVLQTSVLLQQFTVLSSTHEVTGNTVIIGDASGGTIVVSLELRAPDLPGTVTDTVTLVFTEADAPPTQGISITVSGGP